METLINTYIPIQRALFVLGMHENRALLKLQNVMPYEHKALLDVVVPKTLKKKQQCYMWPYSVP
jgi:hypothetical protein